MLRGAARRSLGEPVGQRLQQDVRIIVVGRLEPLEMRLDAVDPDREAADPVLAVGSMKSARHMLARPSRFFTCWRRNGSRTSVVAGQHEHVVALAPAAPQADRRRARVSQCSAMILSSIACASANRLRRAFADHRIVEDRGIIAGQLPGAEERRPVDRACAGRAAAIRRTGGARAAAAPAPCPRDRTESALARASSSVASSLCAAAGARLAQRLIIGGGLVDQLGALRSVADQRRGDADRAAGVEHVDHRARIGRRRSAARCGPGWWSRRRSAAGVVISGPLHLARDGDHLVERRA